MSDTQHTQAEHPKYRYSIAQLLGLSSRACLLFDLSKFTYEAARAGVIPSLDGCAMSTRKSSAASYVKPASTGADGPSNADVLLFQGNNIVKPGRQPKLPPPPDRQKDEGFARFLKKHTSPTHNRVTAGGRIVPMEPRSPPIFALSSSTSNRASAAPEDSFHNTHGKKSVSDEQDFETYPVHQHGSTNMVGPSRLQYSSAMAQPMAGINSDMAPASFSYNPASGLMHPQMSAEYSMVSMPGLVRPFLPGQHFNGPVMSQQLHGPLPTYNSYHSPSNLRSAMTFTNAIGSGPAWSSFDNNHMPPDQGQQLLPGYEMLRAWEQHYANLDVQLQNIDRHRAMHQLDANLAEQRRIIVQQRSDAKDTLREYSAMLGLRRIADSSQDSFATSFNVDAPAYVPMKSFDSSEAVLHTLSCEADQSQVSSNKPKVGPNRRAIPIVPPPDRSSEDAGAPQKTKPANVAKGDAEVDEWGVQTRPAPPEIHREQSRLSDMIQAEQRRLPSAQDDVPQYTSNSRCSDQSQQGVKIDRTADAASPAVELAENAVKQSTPETRPRDVADEMQRVMDAIGRPKGTITRVRLLDHRVIDVEGQGLELSSIQNPPRSGWNSLSRSSTSHTTSLLRPRVSIDLRGNVVKTTQTVPVDRSQDKENMLAAPRGHQKAATDAFLAQFNTVDDSAAVTAKSENRSLRTASNGCIDERGKHPNHLSPSTNLVAPGHAGRHANELSSNTRQGQLKGSVTDQDTMSLQTDTSTFSEVLLNKGYSQVSVQNVNAVGRLPQNLDGSADARQVAQARLAAVEKTKSPRLWKRYGVNGGA